MENVPREQQSSLQKQLSVTVINCKKTNRHTVSHSFDPQLDSKYCKATEELFCIIHL